MKKIDTNIFINKAKQKHNNFYNYDKCDYINSTTSVTITCPIHGDFQQTPNVHLKGHGCSKCAIDKRSKSLSQFINEANMIHHNIYNYDKIIRYKNIKEKLPIECNMHGIFYQTGLNHLQGHGCPICKVENNKLTTNQFIEKANKIHNNVYNYDKCNYINSTTPVIIICNNHGEFPQLPYIHLQGHGCPICGIENKQVNIEDLIIKCNQLFNNKYDYSKVKYINLQTPVTIICPVHGEFTKSFATHYYQQQGCPYCKSSKLENDIYNLLKKLQIEFVYNKRNKLFDWLDGLELDFYIPTLQLAIECQGIQHFEPVDFSGKLTNKEKLNNYNKIKHNDNKKKKLCKEHNVNLIYYSTLNIAYPYKVFTTLDAIEQFLLQIIKDDN